MHFDFIFMVGQTWDLVNALWKKNFKICHEFECLSKFFFVMQRSNIKSYQNSKFLLLISTVYTRYSQKSFFLEIANFSWHSLKKRLFIWYIKINQADKTPFFREQSVYCGSFHLKLFHPLYMYWIFLMIFIWKNVNQILRQPV